MKMEQYKIDIIKANYGKIIVEEISKMIGESHSAIGSLVFRLRQKGFDLHSALGHSEERKQKMKEKWKDTEYLEKMKKRDKKNSEIMKINNPMFNKETALKAHIKAMETQKRPEIRAKKLGINHWHWDGGTSRIYSLRLKKENFEYACFQCERKINVDIHHKDLNEKNNEISNSLPLCRGCHMDLHKLLKKYDNQSIVTLLS
jgi:uncharacterized CHY-type Zn-finger protein